MRRRGATSSIAVEDVPDWVVYCHLADWLPCVEATIYLGDTSPQALAMSRVGNAHRLWFDKKSAWLAQHAPHLAPRELDGECRRRHPIVDPVSRPLGPAL